MLLMYLMICFEKYAFWSAYLDMAGCVGYNLLRAFFGTAFFAVQNYAHQTRKS